MSNHLRDELHACAVAGQWWEPTGKPQIPADWIRDLVVSGKIPDTDTSVHAKGVRIRGVGLDGSLDLESARLRVPLMLESVEVGETIMLEQATGSWLSIKSSRIAGISAYQLRLDHTFDLFGTESSVSIVLDDATIGGSVSLGDGFVADGGVSLRSASIADQLFCGGGTFKNEGGIALNADGGQIGGGVFMGEGFVAYGEVRFLGATINGQLSGRGGAFHNSDGICLNADSAIITGNVSLDGAFVGLGEVRLVGARVGGQLSCQSGTFNRKGGWALSADQAEFGGSVFLNEGFTAHGGVRLLGASIGGQLSFAGGTFNNNGGDALQAGSVRVAGNVFLNDGFVAHGAVAMSGASIAGRLSCEGATIFSKGRNALSLERARIVDDVLLGDGFSALGAVILSRASISGALSCRAGEFVNQDGDALGGDGVEIGGGVVLGEGFTARGRVQFLGASIVGGLSCRGGTFENAGGDALSLDGATIGRDVFLGEGFSAKGDVRLIGASIGGQLSCLGGTFSSPNGIGLNLQESRVGGAFLWKPRKLSPGSQVDLTGASVGLLGDDLACWPGPGLLHLQRFEYAGFAPGADYEVVDRIKWVQRSAPFHSQPYEQLASVYRMVGETTEARAVGIAREKGRNEKLTGWSSRWHSIWGAFTGYGYRPAKSLWIFAVAIVAAGFFFSWSGRSGVMEPTVPNSVASATVCSAEYPCYQPFIYAADVMIPIVSLGQVDAWTADAAQAGVDVAYLPWTMGGALVRFITILLVAVGWALTAAFIASAGRTISRL